MGNDFFRLGSKLSSSTFQAHAHGLSNQGDSNRLFDQHKLILGVYDTINFPVVFKQAYGKKLEDILDTGWASLYLISNKMKSIIEENNLTGWKTFEAQVLDKKGHEIDGYHGLSVVGRCGRIDYSKSEIIEKRLLPNAPMGRYYKGLYVGLNKWDGSDFFLPEKYYGIVITKRAADVLNKSKLTNIKLQNLAEIETPDFALGG